MELIRQDTDYALRALIHLARVRDEQRVAATSLAHAQQIPLSFCHKILRKLVAAGLVTSSPGRKGGFVLARRPSAIRLLDILATIQGPPVVTHCMLPVHACSRRSTCPASRKWRKLQENITAFLKATTLADMSVFADRPAGLNAGHAGLPIGKNIAESGAS